MKKFLILFILSVFTYFNIYSLNEANSLLDTGVNEYNNGQYVFAINNLKKYIQTSSDDTDKPKAYFYIILSYYFLNEYSSSLQYINELSSQYRMSSYTASSYFWRGLIYQNLRQWSDAENAFSKFIEMMPRSNLIERAYLAMANSQLALSKYPQAEKTLKYMIDNFSQGEKYEEASVLYSYVLLQEEKYREDSEFLQPWIEKLGDNGGNYKFKDRFWLYFAEIEIKNNDIQGAEKYLKKIDDYAKNSPSSDIALLRLSQLESLQGNDKESREYLVRLSNEYPYSDYNLDSTISLAVLNYNKNDYDSAITLFNEAANVAQKKLQDLDKYSKNERDRFRSLLANAYYYTAEAYDKQGEKKKAYDYFEKVINVNSDLKDESIIRIIELQLDEKYRTNLNKIVLKYDSTLMNDKKLRDKYLLYKANIEFYNQNYNRVISILDSITDQNAFAYSIAVLKSNVLIKLNKIDEAIDVLAKNQPVIPLNKKAFITYELSNLYFDSGDYDNAVKYAADTKTFASDMPDADKKTLSYKSDFLLAMSYMQLKANDKSIAVFSQLIAADTKNFDDSLMLIHNKSFYYLGWLYYKTSVFIKAANYFNQAENLPIGDDLVRDSYFMEAWSFFSNKDFKNAMPRFEEVYKKYYPDYEGVESLFLMGKCYQNLGNEKTAIDVFSTLYNDKNITSFKDQAFFEIIKYNIGKNGLDNTLSLIDKFKKEFPDSPFYKNLLVLQAENLMQLQRYSEAYSIYALCIDKFSDSADIDSFMYWGGYCAYKINDYIDSTDLLTRLTSSYRDSSFYIDALYLLADTYKKQNKIPDEMDIINKILPLEKNIEKKKEFQERLKKLTLLSQGYDEEESNLIILADSGKIDDRFNLALYYFTRKDRYKGLEQLQQIAKDDNGLTGSKALLLIADDKMKNQIYKDAIDIYLNILTYKTTGDIKAEALYKTAYCYSKLKNNDAMEKVLNKLYDAFPDSQWSVLGKNLEAGLKE